MISRNHSTDRNPSGARPRKVGRCRRVGSSLILLIAALGLLGFLSSASAAPGVLTLDRLAHCVQYFNSMEDQNVTNFIPDAQSLEWLRAEIPLFDCPDPEIEQMYYYRWWSFRKHIEQTPRGFVLSEFLTRPTPVSSALGHQLMEGRWLHDQIVLDDYVRYWLRDPAGTQALHKYSSWLADALYQRYLVTGDQKSLIAWLPDLVADYGRWKEERLAPNGLFWQYDVRDAMEESISGSRTNKNARPSINSYMFGNARAIAAIARLAGNRNVAAEFDGEASRLKGLVQSNLWNADAHFFEVLRDDGRFSGAREEIGFIPWYFELPDDRESYGSAWAQLPDPRGFSAPFGITTAERRHPLFRTHGYGHCEWDGAVWPFATSQTLTALANFLRDYHSRNVTSRDYFDAFLTYTHSQHAGGKPYIGEYLDETTGQWINGKGGRSRYYNHSTYADLLITGVAGLVPRPDNSLEVSPLLPAGVWDWFCLDRVGYRGKTVTIIWDKDGTHYHHGRGLRVLADGIAHGNDLSPLTARIP
jgi:hypothetical protein